MVVPEFVSLDGGEFTMGSDRFYPEEQPVHRARVHPFQLGRFAVTNREFAAFVEATGYLTVAERPLDPREFPDAEDLGPGSLVFEPTPGPVDLRNWRAWWRWVPGASWRHPRGPESRIDDKEEHPVVQVAYEDATAYATWVGGRLPTEAEWEYAARGGLDGATFAWGEEPDDGTRANTWQGRFPHRNDGASGWVYTAPVGGLPPNGYGLHEMTGNTWEWTSTSWRASHHGGGHCAPAAHLGHGGDRMVTKGGSHLCSPEYCLRYRPAARSPQARDSSTTHLGFRLARDLA